MNDLYELVSLISKTKLKTGGLMSAILEPGSRMAQFYDGIASGRSSTMSRPKPFWEKTERQIP